MPGVEVARDDAGQETVFEAMPYSAPPMRTLHLLYAALLEAAFIVVAELLMEPAASMLRWMAALCAAPVILLWAVTLYKAARGGRVRLVVAPDGLHVNGRVYPHDTIRDLAIYRLGNPKPLFVARIEPVSSRQHLAELDLAAGSLGLGGLGEEDGRRKSPKRRHAFRLVLHRRNRRPAVVLVRGLTMAGGETLCAGLAAELRRHITAHEPTL